MDSQHPIDGWDDSAILAIYHMSLRSHGVKDRKERHKFKGENATGGLSRKEKKKALKKALRDAEASNRPVDDSTLSVNSGDFLEKHLKKIVKFIENSSEIEILAIGIGHDVSRYYQKAIKITDVQELGDVMISQLSGLFEKKKLH